MQDKTIRDRGNAASHRLAGTRVFRKLDGRKREEEAEGRETAIISIINIVLRDVSYEVAREVVDLRNHNLRKYRAVLRARRDEETERLSYKGK